MVRLFLWCILAVSHLVLQAGSGWKQAFSALPGVEVERLNSSGPFGERYLLWVDQPLDHNEPGSGVFRQRVIVSLRENTDAVLFVTEGYDAGYAVKGRYVYELSDSLNAHQIVVEHRYYPPSAPGKENWRWDLLNIEQAAADHHRIVALLKPLLGGKWISTGISKGGQAAMFHRSLYPGDVDGTVGYVCPLNFSDMDPRVDTFLTKVGDSVCRERVREFQRQMLRQKDEFLPEFRREAEKQGLHYSIGWESAYELVVLEYAFAFWQWGFPCSSIPADGMDPGAAIAHLDSVAGLDWVAREFLNDNPFFYQALTEIGMYGYDTSYLPGLVSKTTPLSFHFACPDQSLCVFDPQQMQSVSKFLRERAKNIIFIYGEDDPWSATAVQPSENPGVYVYFVPGGNHRSRLSDLLPDHRREVLILLKNWIYN